VLNILSAEASSTHHHQQQLQQQQQQQLPVEVVCEDDSTATGDNIAFTLLSKKGNKQQVVFCLRFCNSCSGQIIKVAF